MMHVGGYLEYRGVFSTVWEKSCYLSTPTILIISPNMYNDIPHGAQITKNGIPHSTAHTLYRMMMMLLRIFEQLSMKP